MSNLNLIIDETLLGTRIDKVLKENFSELSRNHIQILIDQGNVLVNGETTKANYKVRLNDEISINIPEAVEIEAFPQDMNLDIIYEDHDVIVINKPKGMVVHPGPGNPDKTLVNGLLYHCKDLSGINGVLRPGIVHRIDKETTGLIVACKNDIAHEKLAEQLSTKTMNRKYVCLVHGDLPHEYGTIDAPIGRDVKDRQKMSVTEKNSRDAITHFKTLKHYRNYSLIECTLETGRTHQIRVHMQYIGYPIVGDQKYSIKKTRQDTNGQVLHAKELTFVHPTTNESMTFTAPLPEYFQELLDILDTKGDL